MSKITVKRRVESFEDVEIELPYYFEHDCGGDTYSSVYYGRITEHETVSINRTSGLHGLSYEIKRESYRINENSSYLKPEYKSTEAEFLRQKQAMLDFIDEVPP